MTGMDNVEITRFRTGSVSSIVDFIAQEEPLELQLEYGPSDERTLRPMAVTMRTPGHDQDLALGFLWTEGVIDDAASIREILSRPESELSHNGDEISSILPPETRRNRVIVRLHPDAQIRLGSLDRNFYTTSSCGVCGKASINALRVLGPPRSLDLFQMEPSVLCGLPGKLRTNQPLFTVTGGLHGVALVRTEGEIVLIREDVGRHNAVDKLIGDCLRRDALPLRSHCLLLSGRVSFELMQKAVMAGISFVAAVGAPSSLAVSVVKEFNATLVGFLNQSGFNVYSGAHRLVGQTHNGGTI